MLSSLWHRLKCAVGFHDWELHHEVDLPGSGFTENPMDYEVGGWEYHGKCTRCPATTVSRHYGVWIAPKWKGMRR